MSRMQPPPVKRDLRQIRFSNDRQAREVMAAMLAGGAIDADNGMTPLEIEAKMNELREARKPTPTDPIGAGLIMSDLTDLFEGGAIAHGLPMVANRVYLTHVGVTMATPAKPRQAAPPPKEIGQSKQSNRAQAE